MPFFLFLQSLNVRIHIGPYFWLIIDLSDSEKRQWSCHDLTLCIREYAKSNSIGCVCGGLAMVDGKPHSALVEHGTKRTPRENSFEVAHWRS